MKKLILSIALFVGFAVVSNAQTSATGNVPVTKPKAVITVAQPESVPATTTVATTTMTETQPTATTTTTTPTKKSTKKSCCKKKSDGCCKKKTEAVKED